MSDLLLEIFSEEIPARMQARASEDLKKLVTNAMVEAGITYESAAAFATPRRLCLTVSGVLSESKPLREERKGPRTDAPEQAVNGFLRSTGLSLEQLEKREDKKGEVYFAVIEKPGRKAADVVAEAVEAAIRNFPWPKSMRWGSGTLKWVRPMHSILCILSDEEGAEVVPFDIDGIKSGDKTEGHRFMGTGRFSVISFDDYEAKLKQNSVILRPDERAETIWHDASNLAFALGLEVVEDKGLLNEVAGLVECPVVLMGDIAEDFMELPPEVLQTSMKEHQKFFSVRNPKTGRIEKFIMVANRETSDNGATILKGNQKVLFARLSDAKFFWENDLRTVKDIGLEGMAKPLADVTFHNKLGSQAERVERIVALADEIAPMVGADYDLSEKAAWVAKADLCSEMVYEFPELQGLMGQYYAEAANLPQEVANACQAHYSPLGPSDVVPNEPVSIAVALADKLDTLTGLYSIDERPTGSKDPFALRRAALGVIRLILNNELRLNLNSLTGYSFAKNGLPVDWQDVDGKVSTPVEPAMSLKLFFDDRLKVHLKDQGITHDVIDACLEMPNSDDLTLLVKRVHALQAFIKTDDGENLIQGYKRANNILSAEEKKDGVAYEGIPEVQYAEDEAEKALFAALDKAEPEIAKAIEAEDFATAMEAMASLRVPIDLFFVNVQVNSDNDIVRRNRLCLLNRIRAVMQQVAIFSALNG